MASRQRPDYTEVASSVDDLRESLRVMVAAVKAEGFDDEQARAIVTGILGNPAYVTETGEGSE